MEQKLRHYERLSPELAVLTETPNVNNPSTLIIDYLVTGARGWDWLCQLHLKAVILDLENPAAYKTAADELVEFPSIVRAFDDGEKLNFVVTQLGAEAKEHVDALEAMLKAPNVVVNELLRYPKKKPTLTLNILLQCEDPVAYVRNVVETFMAASCKPADEGEVKLNVATDDKLSTSS